MSLLDAIARPCVILVKNSVPGGAGGEIVQWTEGQEFVSYATLNTSREARKAEKQGVTSLYTGMVDGNVPLHYNDFFRDKTTGETFRVTSNPDEKQIPTAASAQLAGKKIFTAERAALPDDEG